MPEMTEQEKREYELYVQYSIMCDENKEFLKAITCLMNKLRTSEGDVCKKILDDFMNSNLYIECIERHISQDLIHS